MISYMIGHIHIDVTCISHKGVHSHKDSENASTFHIFENEYFIIKR
jgi:hypothetical protein